MDKIKRMMTDRLLVQRDEAPNKIGEIYLPDNARDDKAMTGTVLAVGPGRLLDNGQLEPMTVKVGERVCFAKYSGNDTAEKLGKNTIILSQRDLLAVLAD